MRFSFYYFKNLKMSQTVTLSSGYEIPIVGLGTWQMSDDEVESSVAAALKCGYRHIDTAYFYMNEEAIGRSLKQWLDEGNDREELFITTKLPVFGNRANDVETYVNLSLERLGLDYIDMYLIHLPFAFARDEEKDNIALDEDGNVILDCDTDHLSTWKAMEQQVENGKLRSIGLSNFNEAQVLNVFENSKIKPSNLQMELHAYNQERSLRELCDKYGIVVTAYSSLGSPGSPNWFKSESAASNPNLLEHPAVLAISDEHGKSPAQILLRHQIQAGIVVIPKSVNPERIAENIDIFDFELTDDEMQQLDDLDMGADGRLFDVTIFFKGVEKHPLYPY